jgi:hypothetical protein
MRLLLPAVLAALLSACTGPCRELGERLCECTTTTTREICEQQVDNALDDRDPGDGQCERWLDTCRAPEGVAFCEWLQTADAKAACGLAPAP